MKRLLNSLQFAFLFLFVGRSITDAFHHLDIYLGPWKISLSVALGSFMIMIGFSYLSLLFLHRELMKDRIGWIFLFWVLSLSPWVYLAAYRFGIPGLEGVREWIRLLSLVLFYFVIYNISRRKGYNFIVNTCLLALPIPLAVTYYQVFFRILGSASSLSRAYGTFSHPNTLAQFMVVMIGLTIWKFSKSSGKRNALWGAIIVIELPALVLPMSLNGWVMFVVLIVSLIAMIQDNLLKKQFAIFFTIFSLILLLAGIQFSFILAQFTQIWQIRGAPVSRLFIWTKLISQWYNHPIIGYGLKTSNFILPVVGTPSRLTGADPHNDFIRYLVECGILGLLVFVSFQVAVSRKVFSLWRNTEKTDFKNLISVCFGLCLGWILVSIGDNVITSTAFQIYFWSIIATIAGDSH